MLTVRGNLVNGYGSAIDNSGTLRVSGNTTNNGATTAPAGGMLVLDGAAAQTIGGATQLDAADVTMNNPAGVTLNVPLSVSGAMTFAAGIIDASAIGVAFTATGTVSGAPTDASHITGAVRKDGTGPFVFPIGDGLKYQPIGTNLTSNPGGMIARYWPADAGTAIYASGYSPDPTPLAYYNPDEYWNLTPGSASGATAGTVTIYYDGYRNNGVFPNTGDLRVAHKSGGLWRNEGGTVSGTATSGTVTSAVLPGSAWSPFTLGSISVSTPLAVTLVSFTGATDGPANRLEWQTAVEDAGATFTVERSANAADFDALGAVSGRGGNSRYTFRDERPLSPIGYYRLKSTDAAGGVSYSAIVAVQRGAGGVGAVAAFPVPATRAVTITNTDASLNGTGATIYNALGSAIFRFSMAASQTIDLSPWPAGAYRLRLSNGTVLSLMKL